MYVYGREGAARVSGEGNDNGMHRALTKLLRITRSLKIIRSPSLIAPSTSSGSIINIFRNASFRSATMRLIVSSRIFSLLLIRLGH